MNRANVLDNGPSNLPSLRHPTAWEISGHRRRPYTTTGLTPRPVTRDDRGNGHYGHQQHFHRHHAGPTTRDELLYPRGADHRQQMLEMEDLLQRYREELERKDQEILNLTSIDTPRMAGKVDHQYGLDYTSPGVDYAAVQIRVTTLESKLFEAQREIDSREQTIRDLQASIDVRMEADARHESLIQSLRQKLAEYESAYGSIEGAANRSELTIVTLQQQNNDAQQRIVELESRLRTLSDERNGADQRALAAELKLSEMLTQINNILLVDAVSVVTHERTLNAVRDLVHENSMLRGKVSTISDQTRNHDVELQTNRETISRLNAQIDRLNKTTTTTTIDMENIRLERDASVLKLREAEREIELLRDRLEASQTGWSDARRQLDEKVVHCEHHGGRHGVVSAVTDVFLEALSHLLSDSRNFVEPNEERIKERIGDLVHAVRDKNARIEMLERKVADLEHKVVDLELERNELTSSEDRHHKRLRPGIEQLEERLRRAELELAASDRLKDALHAEKAKLKRFLDDVARLLRIESAILEISIDGAAEAILRRLEHITRNDLTIRSPGAGEHSDCHLHIHGLQRKVKNLKEKLNSKELENDLLRKKVSSLEDQLTVTERNDKDREEEFAKNRRLVKLAEKYKFELNEAHTEIRELKARLSRCSEIQVAATEKERELERLERHVGQLEHVREQQAIKITDLQDEANAQAHQLDRHDEAVATRVAILSDEVRTLRQALEETSRRERQLQDLRRVIARMLAIDVIHVPVPDYEIISRLEKLILAQQANSTVASALSIDDIIDDMGDEFRSGYQNAGFVLAPRRPRTHSPIRSSSHHRSKSPAKKLDAKVY